MDCRGSGRKPALQHNALKPLGPSKAAGLPSYRWRRWELGEKKNKSHNRTSLRTVGLRVSVQSAKTLTEHMEIKCFQNLSQSISGPSSQPHMVFCHFELHFNVATSSNGIQSIIKHKAKLEKGSEKNPQLPMNQSTRCCHSAQPQEVSPVETDLFKQLLCSTT